jgi:hypothetical protein
MRDLFDTIGLPKTSAEEHLISHQLAEVFHAMNPDFLGIVEGPTTLVDGSKTASLQMELWCRTYLPKLNFQGVHGFSSPGQ